MKAAAEELSPALFASGFALAVVFHQAAESAWLSSPSDAAATAAAAWLLFSPSSFARLALLAAAQLVDVAVELPYVSNHWLLLGFLSIGVLASAGLAEPRRVYGPVTRDLLLLLYALAFLHKLNRDYLDPASSCAVEIVHGFARLVPLPSGKLVDAIAIAGSLLLEAAIPLLLLVGRGAATPLAIALGAAFHVTLALYPDNRFYNFSSAVLAGYLAFVPANAPLARSWQAWLERSSGRSHRIAASTAILASAVGVAAASIPTVDAAARALWIGLAATLAVVAVREAGRWPNARIAPFLLPQRRAAVVIAIFFLVNGMSPYLGLKTETSFAMYSNLRTEGRSNHLLIPGKLTGVWQDDWVTIVESEDPLLASIAASGKSLTRFQLATLLADRGTRASAIDYRGTRHTWRSGEMPPAFLAAPPFLARKLLYFRPIDVRATAVACSH